MVDRPSLAPSQPFAGFGEDAGLDLPPVTPRVEQQIIDRLLSRDFDAWSDAAARVGHCAHPVKVAGHSTRVDTSTGEILSTYSTRGEALGVLHLRCGNRRAAVCPSCSRLYAADTFQLIRSGVAGGKGVPEHVSENPLVFATLTAPSFGHVHGVRSNGRRCRPRTGKNAARCEHGRPTGCMTIHDDQDPLIGQPLCPLCYDYESHVIWQWWAPELWRRFTIELRRTLARRLGVKEARLSRVAVVQYAKVGEYQRRGLIHFHALVRLDGPKTDGQYAPAPERVTAQLLADCIASAAAAIRFDAPPAFEVDPGRRLAFGVQVDARPVRTVNRPDDPDQSLSGEQVAGYIAKYATKSAADTPDGGDNPHLVRVRDMARSLGEIARTRDVEHPTFDPKTGERVDDPYLLLAKWAHMLGFRGHFSSKSRRYSVTLGQLRKARRRWHQVMTDNDGARLDLADLEAQLLADDDEETTLVIGSWEFAGTGWASDGDAVLANAAAARAREYAQHRVQTKRQAK